MKIMKRSRSARHGLAALALALALTSGCVYSLGPWFTKDVLVLDERLLGTWMVLEEDLPLDEKNAIALEATSWNTYRVSDLGECALGRIGNRDYLDCVTNGLARESAWTRNESVYTKPLEPWEGNCHSLSWITIEEGIVTLRPLDLDKLESLPRKRRPPRGIRVGSSGDETGQLLIVSGASELERFLGDSGSADIWSDVVLVYARTESTFTPDSIYP
jgi:hypothetical protein